MKSTRVTIMTIATVVICGAFVSSARADCGLSARHKLTALGVPNATARTNPMLADASAQEDRDSDSIVGLWHVIFKDSGGQFFDEGYDQFHNDGTEVLNDIPNPAFGNVCLGVYERNDRGEPLTYKLHHVFWDFDSNGNLSGRGVWDSILKLDHSGNSYTGTWSMKNHDLSGNLITSGSLAPVSGTLKARRITVE